MNSMQAEQVTSGDVIYGILLTEKEVKDMWLEKALKHPNCDYHDDTMTDYDNIDIKYIEDYITEELNGFSLVSWGCCYYNEHRRQGHPVFAFGINLGSIHSSFIKQKSLRLPNEEEISNLVSFLTANKMQKQLGLYAIPTGCYSCT